MLHKSFLLLAVVAVCMAVTHAQLVNVSLVPTTSQGSTSGLTNWHENVWATAAGSSTPIYSLVNSTNYLLFELNQGQTYTIHAAQPTFYHYTIDYTIYPTSVRNNVSTMYINFPMVPVASGVTVVNLAGFSYNYLGSAYLNFTFPPGIFNFSHASLYSFQGTVTGANFGAGVPPAQFYLGEMSRFATLPAGTYRVYSEAHRREYTMNGTVDVSSNFTIAKGHYGIFAGDDEVTGFKGAFRSQNRSEATWYIGDIVVTKPSTDCFKYDWATVDTYSPTYGAFDEIDHATTTALTQECFDLSSPSALECVDVLFNDSTPQSTCGAFGDPHIIKFDRVGVTCGGQTYVVLVDNQYFTIAAHAEYVAGNSSATIFTSIVFTYKLPCNPISVTFTDTASAVLSGVNAPLSYRHALRLYGNNIYIDALHLRFQVRRLWGSAGLTFGLSIPTSLVSSSTGVCTDSCPGYEVSLSGTKRATRHAALALAACDTIPSDSYEYESCLFDVGLTGNTDYANIAQSFIQTKAEMETTWTVPDAPPSWPEPTPDTIAPPTTGNNPTGGNPTGSNPTAQAPTNASSALAPTLFVLVLAVAALLF